MDEEREKKICKCLREEDSRNRDQQVQRSAGCLVYLEDDRIASSDKNTT